MVASITRIQSPLNFFLIQISFANVVPKYIWTVQHFQTSVSYLYAMILPSPQSTTWGRDTSCWQGIHLAWQVTLLWTLWKHNLKYIFSSSDMQTKVYSWDLVMLFLHWKGKQNIHLWSHSTGLGSSLYSLGTDSTENTASNSFTVVIGGCLAIARVLMTCLPAATKERRSFSTVLHAIIYGVHFVIL
jgi:hypothetical protein